MPIYEYNCDKCGVVEVMQRITDPALKKCPNCKNKVERMLSRSSFVLKGSGWYATDYGRKGTTDSSSESPGSANGTSKTETKTEAKTESKPKESSTSSTSADKPAAKAAD